MAYDREKDILKVTSESGISLQEVALCLRDYRLDTNGRIDLGMMCTSPNINLWPKNKPVRLRSRGILTDADRKSVNYGIDFSMAHDTSFSDCLAKSIANGGKYGYLRPRGGDTEPYRLLDFDGYNHKAETPYGYTMEHSKGKPDGWVDVYINPNADLTLADLNPTELESGDINSCKLAILLRKEDGTNPRCILPKKDGGGYYTLADIIGKNDGAAPMLRFTVPSEGMWNLAIAITEAVDSNKENDDVFFMYLPEALFRLEYDPAYTGFKWVYADDYALVGRNPNGSVISDTKTNVDNVYANIRIEIDGNAEKTKGTVTIEIGEYGQYFEEIGIYEESFLLDPGQSQDFVKTFQNISSSFGKPYINEIYIRARVTYGSESAEETSMKTVYLDLLNQTIKAEVQEPVSLEQILDATGW